MLRGALACWRAHRASVIEGGDPSRVIRGRGSGIGSKAGRKHGTRPSFANLRDMAGDSQNRWRGSLRLRAEPPRSDAVPEIVGFSRRSTSLGSSRKDAPASLSSAPRRRGDHDLDADALCFEIDHRQGATGETHEFISFVAYADLPHLAVVAHVHGCTDCGEQRAFALGP